MFGYDAITFGCNVIAFEYDDITFGWNAITFGWKVSKLPRFWELFTQSSCVGMYRAGLRHTRRVGSHTQGKAELYDCCTLHPNPRELTLNA